MLRIISLWAAMLLIPLTAHADIVITKPQYATPDQVARNTQYALLYLECGDVRTTAHAVSMLTLAQLNDPDTTVRFTRDLPRACRAGNVTRQGIYHGSWPVQTRDGWVVDVVAWTQSNGWDIAFVDTSQAFLQRTQRRLPEQRKLRRRSDEPDVNETQQILKELAERELWRLLNNK